MEQAHGLADTEMERLASLAEGIEFEDEDQYREKLSVLKESYFSNTPVAESHVSDDVAESPSNNQELLAEEGSIMGNYVSAIARHNRKI
jgi:hypothetical protein